MKRKIWKEVYFGMNLSYRDKAFKLGLHVIKICFMKKKNVSNIIKKKVGSEDLHILGCSRKRVAIETTGHYLVCFLGSLFFWTRNNSIENNSIRGAMGR